MPAPDFENKNDISIIKCKDGGYIIVEKRSDSQYTDESVRAAHTISGSVTYTKMSSSNVVQWTAVLNATFSYDGSSSACTSANCNISFNNTNYSLINKSVTRTGNTAVGTVTIAHKILGITVSTETQTLTLSCDPSGHLY